MVGNTISDAPKHTTYSLRLFKVFRLGQKPYASTVFQIMRQPPLSQNRDVFPYLIAGAIELISIVTIPMSLATFHIVGYILRTYDRTIVSPRENSYIALVTRSLPCDMYFI